MTAKPGEAQVQKSNIILTIGKQVYTKEYEPVLGTAIIDWEEKTILETQEMNWSIVINGGSNGEAISTIQDAPNADEINKGWEYNSSAKTVTIKESGVYHIVGTSNASATQNHIVIADGVEADVFLENVNISVSNAPAFEVQPGAKANVYLAGVNTLTGGYGRAGIEVRGAVNSGDKTASLVINSANSSDSSSFDGVLNVTGGSDAAAIGGLSGYSNNSGIQDGMSGSIEINGGTIVARGGSNAAGIGGGTGGNNGGGTITINGGDVTAFSPLDGAIGTGIRATASSNDNGGTVITITGGRVKAWGGTSAGAGIGGGQGFSSGIIQIKSGLTVIESGPTTQSNFLSECKKYDDENPSGYVYATKGRYDTAAIGHGGGVSSDTPGGVDLNAALPDPVYPSVPDKPIATVESPATILEPIYDETVIEYKEILKETHIDTTLSDISQFYTPSGAFIVSQPQTLTITQGDGQTASITLYADDTMNDVASKINDVIAHTFGNARYTDNPDKFCTLSEGIEGTSESVYTRESIYDSNGNFSGYNINATMLIRSGIPGKSGELSFSGDEDLLNALGLNTIRESSETTYTASLYDAHSGKSIVHGLKTTGNVLSGAIPNVDIEFDPMAGISSRWDDGSKRYVLSEGETYSAFLHLVDETITFQTGANQGEDFAINLGSASSRSLGVSAVSVVTREAASRAIGVIDRAITRVSSQRAKLGAYTNALEHTMTNLTTTSTNLTATESRIRDADMSQAMMEFVKLQILNQSGTSMLAQANQLPQSVLNLVQ